MAILPNSRSASLFESFPGSKIPNSTVCSQNPPISSQLSQKLETSLNEQQILCRKISKSSESKARLKTENRRLGLRLAETEGNLKEVETQIEKLRSHHFSEAGMSLKLSEAEVRLQEAEVKIKDFRRIKKELQETKEKLEISEDRCRQLAESLRNTQAFLVESKRQWTESAGPKK
jgi:chromosome segregation ATPase